MTSILFGVFAVSIALGVGYQLFIAPRRWMKRYGDGVYSPLAKTYKNAGYGSGKSS